MFKLDRKNYINPIQLRTKKKRCYHASLRSFLSFFLMFLASNFLFQFPHSMSLEWWNKTKSLSNIWQHLSCLLDKGTAKYARNLITMMAFWGQTKTGQKQLPDWLDWLSYLQAYLCNPLIKYTWKMLSNGGKTLIYILPL